MPEYVYVKARIISRQHKALTVRLVDGFGNNQTVIHTSKAISAALRGARNVAGSLPRPAAQKKRLHRPSRSAFRAASNSGENGNPIYSPEGA